MAVLAAYGLFQFYFCFCKIRIAQVSSHDIMQFLACFFDGVFLAVAAPQLLRQ